MMIYALLVCAGLISNVSPAHAIELAALDEIYKEVLNHHDLASANAAVQKVAQHKYSETARTLFEGLQNVNLPHARGKRSPTSYFIKYSLEAIGDMASAGETEHLRRSKQNIERLVRDCDEKSELLRLYEATLAKISGNLLPMDSFVNGAAPPAPVRRSLTPKVGGAKSVGTEPVPYDQLAEAPAATTATKIKLTSELITGNQGTGVDDLINYLESNLYDDMVNLLNAGQALPSLYARDKELEFMLQGLRRTTKNHLLLVGVAGVGKTALLKQLQIGWLTGTLPYPGDEVPLIMELSITDITNPTDPTLIKTRLKAAKAFAKVSGRHVVLFLDEARTMTPLSREAVKGFLSEENGMVHLVINTTAKQARAFKDDPAFLRRWVQANVPELETDEAITAIRQSKIGDWQRIYSHDAFQLGTVTDDAFRFAAKYSALEQPHAGQMTGLKELVEGAIILRLRTLERASAPPADGRYDIEPEHIRDYLKFKTGRKLYPGDKHFDEIFDKMWTEMRAEYLGQAGLLAQLRQTIKDYLQSFDTEMALAFANFGPPGGGKSYLPEMLAKHFFAGAVKPINSGMFSDNGHPLNQLIGSTVGHVGSEEQRGILTEFIAENPNGGLIVFEEADFLPQEVLDFLADAITNKGFYDGLANWYSLDGFILLLNSNVGQELLLPEAKSTWSAFEARRAALTHVAVIGDGAVEVVRPDKLDKIFDDFKMKVARGRGGREVDQAQVRQNAMKLNRRITPIYTILPSRDDLRAVALKRRDDFVRAKRQDFGVNFEIPDDVLDAVIDLDHYRFDQGYSFVVTRLTKHLTGVLNSYQSRKGATVRVAIGEAKYKVGRRTITGSQLLVTVDDDPAPAKYALGIDGGNDENQWITNEAIKDRIRNLPVRLSANVRHQSAQINFLHQELKGKVQNWRSQITLSQIGSEGVGRSHLAYALSEALFDTPDAVIEIPVKNTWEELQNEFRSPVGFVGSNSETALEAKFMALKNAGGGIFLLRNFLSLPRGNPRAMAERLAVFEKLQPLLERREIQFGNRGEDASGFIVILTGDTGAEAFQALGDDPADETIAKRILEQLDEEQIHKYFASLGMSTKTIRSFGRIFTNGPLPKKEIHRIAQHRVNQQVARLEAANSQYSALKVSIAAEAVRAVVDRVSNVALGMKNVGGALDKVLLTPLRSILFDVDGADRVDAEFNEEKLAWFADGERVVPVAQYLEDEVVGSQWNFARDAKAGDVIEAPGLKDVERVEKMQMTPENTRLVVRHEWGHWVVKYLFSRRSNVLSVSAIPQAGSLGRVAHDIEHLHDVTGITYFIKEMAELAAGAQAGFRAGIFAAGAGHVPRGKDEPRNDDYSKVEHLIKAVINNGLIAGANEHSAPRTIEVIRAFLMELAHGLADQALAYVEEVKIFDPLFQRFLDARFLDEPTIQKFLSQADLKTLEPADDLFLKLFTRALTEAFARTEGAVDVASLDRLQKLAVDLHRKVVAETKTLNAERVARGHDGPGLDLDQVKELEKDVAADFNCEKGLSRP